jgi:hypothetical protein
MNDPNYDRLETESARQLHLTIMRLMQGIRDPEAARESRERMDREREELRQKFGTLDIVVDLVRDAREFPREFMRDPNYPNLIKPDLTTETRSHGEQPKTEE